MFSKDILRVPNITKKNCYNKNIPTRSLFENKYNLVSFAR